MSNDLEQFLGECPTHKKLPWKIGAIESGRVAIDSDDDQEVTGWIDPEDAYLILNQQQEIESMRQQLASRDAEVAELRNLPIVKLLTDSEKECDHLREQVKMLRGIVENVVEINPSLPMGMIEAATEALAATEPRSTK